ncbi:MAG TPA: phosphatase PAP2 family protein [Euzebyales bacterium]|nr:phosphatase PAP2 family protein [Euzebyales bacterium]
MTAADVVAASPDAVPAARRPVWRSIAAMGAGMVGGSLVLLSSARLRRADVRMGDLVRRSRSGQTDRLIAAATDLGSMYGVVGTATALGAAGYRRLARDVMAVGSAAWVVAQGAKTRVRRERPYQAEGVARLIRPPTGSSYPSGHAAVTAAMMSVIAADGGRPVRLTAGGLVVFVAASRVYVGVHYPSDVLGGAGMGLLLARSWRAIRRALAG